MHVVSVHVVLCNFKLKHVILYIYCIDLFMCGIKELDFSFYNFSVILYNFLKFSTFYENKKERARGAT